MNKKKIIAALHAAGIPEANESMTLEALKTLAAEKGVTLTSTATSKGRVPDDDYYDGLRQAKVAAGLPLETAIEVTARQRKEDEANGFMLPEIIEID